ncbi:hypothetical protein [Enterobacter mori]|uniref:hypothetical protein n=1 Tax=Enterobacter mori TaxID=539813 RepID=UPI003B83A839
MSLFTATTDATVSIENKSGSSQAVLAIDVATPMLDSWHRVQNAFLKAGESVYEKYISEPHPQSPLRR